MAHFLVDFIDGTKTGVEADAYELRDEEWVFRRGSELIAHWAEHHVRGIQKLPEDPVQVKGGGAWT